MARILVAAMPFGLYHHCFGFLKPFSKWMWTNYGGWLDDFRRASIGEQTRRNLRRQQQQQWRCIWCLRWRDDALRVIMAFLNNSVKRIAYTRTRITSIYWYRINIGSFGGCNNGDMIFYDLYVFARAITYFMRNWASPMETIGENVEQFFRLNKSHQTFIFMFFIKQKMCIEALPQWQKPKRGSKPAKRLLAKSVYINETQIFRQPKRNQ